MSNDEIVRALRCCNAPKGHRCSECPVFGKIAAYPAQCKAIVDKKAADALESLQTQLAESHKRELAAVEDWKTYEESGQCDVCKYGEGGDCTYPEGGRCKFEWRGTQEAGEGETE